MGCTVLPPHRSATSRDCRTGTRRRDVSHLSFPAGDRVDLPATGLDARHPALAPVIERAFDGKTYGESAGVVTTAVIIVKDGSIIAERFRSGLGIHAGYRNWSTAKSISAALLAIAAKQGLP
jgi:CubicO group peptidase (beta-lactamase class C family)